MSRYKNLNPKLKYKYLGIQEKGYNPLEFDVKEIKRSEEDIQKGKHASLEEIERRKELGLPSPDFTVKPPGGKSRHER